MINVCVCCVSGSQSSVFALIFVFPVLKDKTCESETTPSEPVNRTTVSLDLLPLALSPEAVLNTDPLGRCLCEAMSRRCH